MNKYTFLSILFSAIGLLSFGFTLGNLANKKVFEEDQVKECETRNGFMLVNGLPLRDCSTIIAPKYRAGDCLHMSAMQVDKNGEWTSAGKSLGMFKIIGIFKSDKINKYMSSKLHAKYFYKIKFVYEMTETGYAKQNTDTADEIYVLPVEDLDKFRYATRFWETGTSNVNNCNEVKGVELTK